MTGSEYRDRCVALGLDITALAEMLGINRRGLYKRFQAESAVRTELILALEMIEHRMLSFRYDRAMEHRGGAK